MPNVGQLDTPIYSCLDNIPQTNPKGQVGGKIRPNPEIERNLRITQQIL